MLLWIQAHYIAIAVAASMIVATVINRLPPAKVPWWLSALADLLAVAAKPGHVGIAGAVNLPLLPSRPKGSTVAPSVAALVLLFALPTLSSCSYCLDQAHKNEPRCVAQDTASKCGTPAVTKLVEQILPQVVLALVSDDWSHLLDGIVLTLEHQGVQDALQAVTCAVASTDFNISGGVRAATLNPALLQSVHEHAVAWLGLHRGMARR